MSPLSITFFDNEGTILARLAVVDLASDFLREGGGVSELFVCLAT
jgi:hypothetical protein